MDDENTILRRLCWLNHGHAISQLYGDDGEMQCQQCLEEYGFWDWKRTPAHEIEEKITSANLRRAFLTKQPEADGKATICICGTKLHQVGLLVCPEHDI